MKKKFVCFLFISFILTSCSSNKTSDSQASWCYSNINFIYKHPEANQIDSTYLNKAISVYGEDITNEVYRLYYDFLLAVNIFIKENPDLMPLDKLNLYEIEMYKDTLDLSIPIEVLHEVVDIKYFIESFYISSEAQGICKIWAEMNLVD